jgi:hypothetical protein
VGGEEAIEHSRAWRDHNGHGTADAQPVPRRACRRGGPPGTSRRRGPATGAGGRRPPAWGLPGGNPPAQDGRQPGPAQAAACLA